MVLASQVTRPEASRRGAALQQRWGSPWLWVALVVILVACGALAYWGYHNTHQAADAPAAAVDTRHASDTTLRRDDSTTVATSSPPAATPSAPNVSAPAPGVTLPVAPSAGASTALAQGMKLIDEGKPVEARALLSGLLFTPATPDADAAFIRDTLTQINQRLVFSKEIVPGDPFAEIYVVQPGDKLVRIAPKYKVPYQGVELINGINSTRLQAGQKLKMIKGPFHAIVTKSAFRLDLYLNGPDGKKIYVRSFPVGLGEGGSTPPGSFIIHNKVKGGGYTNPRTGETFAPGDPKNPIGKYWMALRGTDDKTLSARGYGIHGTVDPSSIGKQMSMGCVRLGDDDIAVLFNLLGDGQSTVVIQP